VLHLFSLVDYIQTLFFRNDISCAEWCRCLHTICFCLGHQCRHPEPLKTSLRMAVVFHPCLFIYYFTFSWLH
jgi:hypothetical protein